MKVTGLRATRTAALGLALCLASQVAHGACLDLTRDNSLRLEGSLYFQVFGGPPYNGGVSKGEKVDRVQIFPGDDNATELFKSLRRLVGRRVRVEGKSAFGAHTGHHHAPLLLPIARVVEISDPTEADGGGMAAVQAFYLALAEGNGEEAARLVMPEKRASGSLSAPSITGFYRHLDEMLALMEVKRSGADQFKVRYTFVSHGDRRCDGAAIVRTVAVKGENLISSIRTLNGC